MQVLCLSQENGAELSLSCQTFYYIWKPWSEKWAGATEESRISQRKGIAGIIAACSCEVSGEEAEKGVGNDVTGSGVGGGGVP